MRYGKKVTDAAGQPAPVRNRTQAIRHMDEIHFYPQHAVIVS
jgi:hypothetical protein